MSQVKPGFWPRLWQQVFPVMPDFYGMLAAQSRHAADTVALFVRFMETGEEEAGLAVRREEHEADRTKVQILQVLNESFATPFDREDIHRAVISMDEVVNYCKTTVREMDVLGVVPDGRSAEMARILREGAEALAQGFAQLAKAPVAAEEAAAQARKAERRIEKVYRTALSELFQGEDYLRMFKYREIYRHLSNAADHLSACALTLSDIIVKTS